MTFEARVSIEQMMTKDSSYRRSALRYRIIRENVLPYHCSICGLDKWLNEPLSLVLDHINGVNNDHRKENLRWLCPNCNSQTDTFSGRNTAKAKRCCPCGIKITRHSKTGLCRSCSMVEVHRNSKAGVVGNPTTL